MPPPIKRPFQDANQYYAYIWRLNSEVIWVGHGKAMRGRPTKSNKGGRPIGLQLELDANWEVINLESHLVK